MAALRARRRALPLLALMLALALALVTAAAAAAAEAECAAGGGSDCAARRARADEDDLAVEDDVLGALDADDVGSVVKHTLGGGEAESPQPPAPAVDNLTDAEIRGELMFLSPTNGSMVQGRAVVVRLGGNTNCINVTRFQAKFNHSNVCISLDASPYSCWPLYGLSSYPLFTNVTSGTHRLVAKLVDPATQLTIADSAGAEVEFTVNATNTTIAEEEEDQEDEDEDEDPDAEVAKKKKKKDKETISIPQVGIEQPGEEMIVQPTFEVRLHVVTSANLTTFRRLFTSSYICLSLDESLFQSCWPIFEESYYPKFYDVAPGKHTLVAHLSHPNTMDIIPGTALGVRNYWVSADKSSVPIALREPSLGSHAFREGLKREVAEEVRQREREASEASEASEVSEVSEHKQAKGKKSAAAAAAAAATASEVSEVSEHKQAKGKKSAAAAAAAAAAATTAADKSKGKSKNKSDVKAAADKGRGEDEVRRFAWQQSAVAQRDPSVQKVTLQINVDNERHRLVVTETDDSVAVAARFCVDKNIVGQSCIASINKLIEIEWKKTREIPHLELYSM
jgi:hypothetical protein